VPGAQVLPAVEGHKRCLAQILDLTGSIEVNNVLCDVRDGGGNRRRRHYKAALVEDLSVVPLKGAPPWRES
jgi:hypothetical protein